MDGGVGGGSKGDNELHTDKTMLESRNSRVTVMRETKTRTANSIFMKKIIAILSLAVFACAAYAGSDCCPKKEKKECPSKEAGKCPAGGDQQKQESKS